MASSSVCSALPSALQEEGAMSVEPYEWPEELRPGASSPRTLQGSRFLAWYDEVPKEPSADDVSAHMARVTSASHVEAYRILTGAANGGTDGSSFKTAAVAAVHQWSSVTESQVTPKEETNVPPVFKTVNRALIADADSLEHWVWWVRALNGNLTSPANAPKRDLVTFRGSKMSGEQAALLRPGAVVRPCMFVASSLDRRVGNCFTGEGRYLFRFSIPSGSRNATAIYKLTKIEDEQEVLFPPYTPLWVRKWHDEDFEGELYHVISADVLDGMVVHMIEQGLISKDAAPDMVPDGRELPDDIFGRPAISCIV